MFKLIYLGPNGLTWNKIVDVWETKMIIISISFEFLRIDFVSSVVGSEWTWERICVHFIPWTSFYEMEKMTSMKSDTNLSTTYILTLWIMIHDEYHEHWTLWTHCTLIPQMHTFRHLIECIMINGRMRSLFSVRQATCAHIYFIIQTPFL